MRYFSKFLWKPLRKWKKKSISWILLSCSKIIDFKSIKNLLYTCKTEFSIELQSHWKSSLISFPSLVGINLKKRMSQNNHFMCHKEDKYLNTKEKSQQTRYRRKATKLKKQIPKSTESSKNTKTPNPPQHQPDHNSLHSAQTNP